MVTIEARHPVLLLPIYQCLYNNINYCWLFKYPKPCHLADSGLHQCQTNTFIAKPTVICKPTSQLKLSIWQHDILACLLAYYVTMLVLVDSSDTPDAQQVIWLIVTAALISGMADCYSVSAATILLCSPAVTSADVLICWLTKTPDTLLAHQKSKCHACGWFHHGRCCTNNVKAAPPTTTSSATTSKAACWYNNRFLPNLTANANVDIISLFWIGKSKPCLAC